MTEHSDQLYLVHIEETSSLIGHTVKGGKANFLRDADIRDATLYRLQILAESTQRLSDQFKEAHPEIPWRDIAGFRNRVVHGYLSIDPEIVWDIVANGLRDLVVCVREALGLQVEIEPSERERDRDIGFDR